jgi:hypothetical protein
LFSLLFGLEYSVNMWEVTSRIHIQRRDG